MAAATPSCPTTAATSRANLQVPKSWTIFRHKHTFAHRIVKVEELDRLTALSSGTTPPYQQPFGADAALPASGGGGDLLDQQQYYLSAPQQFNPDLDQQGGGGQPPGTGMLLPNGLYPAQQFNEYFGNGGGTSTASTFLGSAGLDSTWPGAPPHLARNSANIFPFQPATVHTNWAMALPLRQKQTLLAFPAGPSSTHSPTSSTNNIRMPVPSAACLR